MKVPAHLSSTPNPDAAVATGTQAANGSSGDGQAQLSRCGQVTPNGQPVSATTAAMPFNGAALTRDTLVATAGVVTPLLRVESLDRASESASASNYCSAERACNEGYQCYDFDDVVSKDRVSNVAMSSMAILVATGPQNQERSTAIGGQAVNTTVPHQQPAVATESIAAEVVQQDSFSPPSHRRTRMQGSAVGMQVVSHLHAAPRPLAAVGHHGDEDGHATPAPHTAADTATGTTTASMVPPQADEGNRDPQAGRQVDIAVHGSHTALEPASTHLPSASLSLPHASLPPGVWKSPIHPETSGHCDGHSQPAGGMKMSRHFPFVARPGQSLFATTTAATATAAKGLGSSSIVMPSFPQVPVRSRQEGSSDAAARLSPAKILTTKPMTPANHTSDDHQPHGTQKHSESERGESDGLHPQRDGSSYELESTTTASMAIQHKGVQTGDGTHHNHCKLESNSRWQPLPSPSPCMPLPLPLPLPAVACCVGSGSASSSGSAAAAVPMPAGTRRPLDNLLREALRQTHKHAAIMTSSALQPLAGGVGPTDQWQSGNPPVLLQQHQQQQLQQQQQEWQLGHLNIQTRALEHDMHLDGLPTLGDGRGDRNVRPVLPPAAKTTGNASGFTLITGSFSASPVVPAAIRTHRLPVRGTGDRQSHASGNRSSNDGDGGGRSSSQLARTQARLQWPWIRPGGVGLSDARLPSGCTSTAAAMSTAAAGCGDGGSDVRGTVKPTAAMSHALGAIKSPASGNHIPSAPAGSFQATITTPLLRPTVGGNDAARKSSPRLAGAIGSLTASASNPLAMRNPVLPRVQVGIHPGILACPPIVALSAACTTIVPPAAAKSLTDAVAAAASTSGSAATAAVCASAAVAAAAAADAVTSSMASASGYDDATVPGCMSDLLAQVADTLARQDEVKRARKRKRHARAEKERVKDRIDGEVEGRDEGGVKAEVDEVELTKERNETGQMQETMAPGLEGRRTDQQTIPVGRAFRNSVGQPGDDAQGSGGDICGQGSIQERGRWIGVSRSIGVGLDRTDSGARRGMVGDRNNEGGYELQGVPVTEGGRMPIPSFLGGFSHVAQSSHPPSVVTATGATSSAATLAAANGAAVGVGGGGGAAAAAVMSGGVAAPEASERVLDFEQARANLLQYEARMEDERIRRLRIHNALQKLQAVVPPLLTSAAAAHSLTDIASLIEWAADYILALQEQLSTLLQSTTNMA